MSITDLQAAPEGHDTNLGRKLVRDGDDLPGTITARDGDRYTIAWSDGTEGFVLASSLADADREHLSRNKTDPKGAARSMRNALATLRSDASQVEKDAAVAAALTGPLDPSKPGFDKAVAARLKADPDAGKAKAPATEKAALEASPQASRALNAGGPSIDEHYARLTGQEPPKKPPQKPVQAKTEAPTASTPSAFQASVSGHLQSILNAKR